MLLYVVSIASIKVLDIKMISSCPIVAKAQLIIEILVAEVGMVEQRADKEAAN